MHLALVYMPHNIRLSTFAVMTCLPWLVLLNMHCGNCKGAGLCSHPLSVRKVLLDAAHGLPLDVVHQGVPMK